MPNRTNDPKRNKKKRHIGNDFVAIVYNDAGDGSNYKLGTVKGQFIYACVVITPLEQGSNQVEIVCRSELNEPLVHVKVSKCIRIYIWVLSITLVWIPYLHDQNQLSNLYPSTGTQDRF